MSLKELANGIRLAHGMNVSLSRSRRSSWSGSFHNLVSDQKLLRARPWRNLPNYFTHVYILTLALTKMTVHAELGGNIEIMGMLMGKISGPLFIVLDVYALPVEGTETRVNAQSEAYEYMVQYLELIREVRDKDSIVGWYHSHPGYGCWLSGIDVATQSLNQNFQDPYLAIVIDPTRTKVQGKVEIGAFRTHPVGYTNNSGVSESGRRGSGGQSKPKDKNNEMGAHSESYYALDVRIFQTPGDASTVDCVLDESWSKALVDSELKTLQYHQDLCARINLMMTQDKAKNTAGKRINPNFNLVFENLARSHDSYMDGRWDAAGDKPHAVKFEVSSSNDCEIDEIQEVENESFFMETAIEEGDPNEEQEDGEHGDDEQAGLSDDDSVNKDAAHSLSEVMSLVSEEQERVARQLNKVKGTKRDQSEETRSGIFCESTSQNRKRFAGGEGSALDNELKHKMQTLHLELKSHKRATATVGHAELSRLIGARAQQRVFGGHKN